MNFGGIYVNTSHARVGDKGSEALPKVRKTPSWPRSWANFRLL
jgi:hypothetical protein